MPPTEMAALCSMPNPALKRDAAKARCPLGPRMPYACTDYYILSVLFSLVFSRKSEAPIPRTFTQAGRRKKYTAPSSTLSANNGGDEL